MKPIKIEAGDLKQNLKWYMFITNEYGKPTDESIDLFITSFVNYLKNDTFSLNDRQSFDNWWAEIEKDLSDRGLYHLANCNGGYEWFKQIGTYCKDKTFESDEELKQYILESEVPEYMAHYDLDFSITPDLIREDEKGKYIECYIKYKGYINNIKLYGDGKADIVYESYIKEFNSPSSAASYIYCRRSNGWLDIRNSKGQHIDIYRQSKKVEELKNEHSKDKKEVQTPEQKLHNKLKKYYHTDVKDWIKEEGDLFNLIGYKKNGDISEMLILNVNTGAVKVEKSMISTLINTEYTSFEDYLIEFYLLAFDKYGDKKYKEVETQFKQLHKMIMSDSNSVWKLFIDEMDKPLNKVFIW